MRYCVNVAFLLFWMSFSFGQLVQRNDLETAEQFVKRFKPEGSTLTHKVLETKWNGFSVIISLYDQIYKLSIQKDSDQNKYHKIIGAVFIQLDKNSYRKTTFGTIDTEGGDPNIETVFFANADTDKAKELIIIASWEQRHYDFNGTLYGTYVFDYDLAKSKLDWEFIEGIGRKLDGDCECNWRDGTSKKSKFKTEL